MNKEESKGVSKRVVGVARLLLYEDMAPLEILSRHEFRCHVTVDEPFPRILHYSYKL